MRHRTSREVMAASAVRTAAGLLTHPLGADYAGRR
jgi:hypothetical protein